MLALGPRQRRQLCARKHEEAIEGSPSVFEWRRRAAAARFEFQILRFILAVGMGKMPAAVNAKVFGQL
jgi:hypothetical protein